MFGQRSDVPIGFSEPTTPSQARESGGLQSPAPDFGPISRVRHDVTLDSVGLTSGFPDFGIL